jgi:hypothetical protein
MRRAKRTQHKLTDIKTDEVLSLSPRGDARFGALLKKVPPPE